MKGYHILVIAAALLVVFGLISLSLSFPNQNLDKDVTISAGPYYYLFTVRGFPGLNLTIRYILASAGTLDVYVLTQDEYATFANMMYPSGWLLAQTNRTVGSFGYTFPAFATYYVTFSHHAGVTGGAQTLHVTATVSGTNPLWLGGGIAMLALAGVAFVVARRKRKASRRAIFAAPPRGGQLLYKPRTQR